MIEASLKIGNPVFVFFDVSILALYILVRLLVVENFFKYLEKSISIEREELLHEAFICTESDNVHGVETPTFLT